MNAVLAGLFGILGQFGEGVFAPGQGGRLVGIVKDLISTDYDHPDMPFLMFCAILREACERDAFAAFARAGADRAPDIAEEITRRLFADMGMDRAACGEVLGMIAALAGVDGLIAPPKIAAPISPLSPGDNLAFGGINWRMLAISPLRGLGLIISEDILEMRPYCDDLKNISWRKSSARKYLNTAFYRSFPKDDRERIFEIAINNPDNAIYGTAGDKDTYDHIFLLSIDEVMTHFADAASRIAKYRGQPTWWWLRSPGATNRGTMGINFDGSFGAYSSLAAGRVARGLRPAMYIHL